MAAPATEGVIRFQMQHTSTSLSDEDVAAVRTLLGWRALLFRVGMLGQRPGRYGGAAWGNVSARASSGFVVSASQTGGMPVVDEHAFASVTRWEIDAARVTSHGALPPSSESLTHAAIYDATTSVNAVLHVHCPELFHADALALPHTPAGTEYGTIEMAHALSELLRAGAVASPGVVVMKGHEDGVIAFGASVDDAGRALLSAFAQSLALA